MERRILEQKFGFKLQNSINYVALTYQKPKSIDQPVIPLKTGTADFSSSIMNNQSKSQIFLSCGEIRQWLSVSF